MGPTNSAFRYCFVLLTLFVGGCVLAPPETRQEQRRMEAAGVPYEPPIEQRKLLELPAPATWRDVLHRAFLANGELASAYFEWKAALARVPQAAGYPNTRLAPSFGYMFSPARMKSFDRLTVTTSVDPMSNLVFPTKVATAGRQALAAAQATGKRFEATKFDLQRRVLDGYLGLMLMEELIRIQQRNVELLNTLTRTAADRLQAGGSQQDLLRAQTQYRLAQNELVNMDAQHHVMRAMLNGMLVIPAHTEIQLPATLPPPRPIHADDSRLIALAVENNPDLARLARESGGRQNALELAQQSYIPDINPFAAFTGGASQMIGAVLILPTTIPQIQGSIAEARAMLRSSQEMLRQARSDKTANFVAALYVLRNSERQGQLFERDILPLAEQASAATRQAYATGTGTFTDVIESERTALEVRRMIAESRIERERRLAELEQLAGVDIETLAAPTTADSRQSATHQR